MRKIITSLAMIAAIGAIVVGATGAYFSDSETSTGNTFSAGSIDLTIDNTCYYNGMYCNGDTWVGGDLNGEDCSCTWDVLGDDGEFFFDFTDIKPEDEGEDTISVNVGDNDAWACAKITLTMNDDVDCTEPELSVDGTCIDNDANLFDGELAQELHFVWWPDDGDNVLEDDEEAKIHMIGKLSNILSSDSDGNDYTINLTLADSEWNFWNNTVGLDQPLEADKTYYIGKAWCFGNLTTAPIAQDGFGDKLNPLGGTGISCDGELVTNKSQTDLVEGTLEFTAVQTRNNADYLCPEHD